MTNIETFPKGKRIGVNRDGKAVGYAVRTNLKNQPEHWTAFVNIEQPPFDTARTGFGSAESVVEFIAKNGFAR
jgi:hypothetical protein